jgi:hypothetical protein
MKATSEARETVMLDMVEAAVTMTAVRAAER